MVARLICTETEGFESHLCPQIYEKVSHCMYDYSGKLDDALKLTVQTEKRRPVQHSSEGGTKGTKCVQVNLE